MPKTRQPLGDQVREHLIWRRRQFQVESKRTGSLAKRIARLLPKAQRSEFVNAHYGFLIDLAGTGSGAIFFLERETRKQRQAENELFRMLYQCLRPAGFVVSRRRKYWRYRDKEQAKRKTVRQRFVTVHPKTPLRDKDWK